MKMVEWVLIFYISGYQEGGPGSATFSDEKSCLNATYRLQESTSRYTFGMCFPKKATEDQLHNKLKKKTD
jgi:hypothetical protein